MEKIDFWHEIEKKFWLVVRAKSPLCATYAHESKEAAFEEAERLARKENDRFLVLECVGYCETNSLRVVRFDTHKDVSHDADIYNRAYADVINSMSIKSLQVRRKLEENEA